MNRALKSVEFGERTVPSDELGMNADKSGIPALERLGEKPSPAIRGLVIFVSKPFRSLFHFMYERLFPLGYEDETGFHYGVQTKGAPNPAKNEEE
jgi:hypothetical protein